MIIYTDTMCMIPEWLYVNLISLLGNSVIPLALFTGNKKKRKLCSSYYALISKIDNLPYCGELFFVSFVPSSSLSCYAPVDTPTHIFIANFIFSAPSCNLILSPPKHLFFQALHQRGGGGTAQVVFDIFIGNLPKNKCILKLFWSFGVNITTGDILNEILLDLISISIYYVLCRPTGGGPRIVGPGYICSMALLWSKKRHVTNTGPNRMRKWSFFVTHAGSQLTFMTQDEKVIIFRYPRGVTTDLLDV